MLGEKPVANSIAHHDHGIHGIRVGRQLIVVQRVQRQQEWDARVPGDLETHLAGAKRVRVHQVKGFPGFLDRALRLGVDWRIGSAHKSSPLGAHQVSKRSGRRHYGDPAPGTVDRAKLSDNVRLQTAQWGVKVNRDEDMHVGTVAKAQGQAILPGTGSARRG